MALLCVTRASLALDVPAHHPLFALHLTALLPPCPRYVGLALLYYYTFDIARAAVWQWDWVLFLWARNLATELLLYGSWHAFLYELPRIRAKMQHKKFNPKWPSRAQHNRDMFWTTSGFTISTVFEAVMYHLLVQRW